MGRPKASQSNLRIAEAFVNAVTLPGAKPFSDTASKGEARRVSVDALFQVLTKCIPSIIRETSERYPMNRNGVASAELRKHLIRLGGYVIRRFRQPKTEVPGTSAPRTMYWSSRRWADCNDPADRLHLKSRICELAEAFPKLEANLDTGHIARTIAATLDEPGNATFSFDDEALNSESSCDGEDVDEDKPDHIAPGSARRIKIRPGTAASSLLTSNRSALCTARHPSRASPTAPLPTRCYIRILPDGGGGGARAPPRGGLGWIRAGGLPPGSPGWAAFVANVHYQLGIRVRSAASPNRRLTLPFSRSTPPHTPPPPPPARSYFTLQRCRTVASRPAFSAAAGRALKCACAPAVGCAASDKRIRSCALAARGARRRRAPSRRSSTTSRTSCAMRSEASLPTLAVPAYSHLQVGPLARGLRGSNSAATLRASY